MSWELLPNVIWAAKSQNQKNRRRLFLTAILPKHFFKKNFKNSFGNLTLNLVDLGGYIAIFGLIWRPPPPPVMTDAADYVTSLIFELEKF